jgi:hypothetical protein
MVVIGHHGIGADIDGKDPAYGEHALPDPLPSVFVALTGMGILTAEKGATHAAGDTVVVGGSFEGDQRFPWLGHDISPWYPVMTS